MTVYHKMSIAQMISEGLKNEDHKLLSTVFCKQRCKSDISSAIAELPGTVIMPLMTYLRDNKPVRWEEFPNHLTWLHSTLLLHYNLLKTLPLPERKTLLEPLQIQTSHEDLVRVQEWKARLDHFHRKKELQLLASTVDSGVPETESQKNSGTLFTGNDESSDDDLCGVSTVGASESEDNWDELSEVGFGGSDDESDSQSASASSSSKKAQDVTAEAEMIEVEDDTDMEAENDASDHEINLRNNDTDSDGGVCASDNENMSEDEVSGDDTDVSEDDADSDEEGSSDSGSSSEDSRNIRTAKDDSNEENSDSS